VDKTYGMWQYVDYARFFSSPKHDVLMVSYGDGWLFVVRRRVLCVFNVLSVDTLENPTVIKICQNVWLGNI